MANTLIKAAASLLLLANLFNSSAKAANENFKQCFYIITREQTSKVLKENLNSLENMKIPVFAVIDPEENISREVIEVIEGFQEDSKLKVLLKDKNELEKSYFSVKGYGKRLKLSGLCAVEKDKFFYIGENNIPFALIEITAEPLKLISEVNRKKQESSNYALVVNGDKFNISTLLLAYNELQGMPLELSEYSFTLKEKALIYKIFTSIGDVTIVFFSVSIVIFIIAIVIFKKWSREKFLE